MVVRVPGWYRRVVLTLRWHTWRQLGRPLRALHALDEQIACWAAWEASRGAPDEGVAACPSQKGAWRPEHTSSPVHLLATRAHVLGQLGRWQDARTQLEQVRALSADQAAHAFNLGYVCAQLGDADAAAQAFRACLDLAPQMDQAWFGLGEALCTQGDFAGAEVAWAKQVSLQPLCPDGYVKLVRLFTQLGNAVAARSWLNRLREFEPRCALSLEPLVGQLTMPDPTLLVAKPA